jgi:hypothetical protein
MSSISAPLTVRGRAFSSKEIEEIRAIILGSPDAGRYALSVKVCRELDWRQPNGRLKDRSCRDVLRRLESMGILRLPPPRPAPSGRLPIVITERSAPRPDLELRPCEIGEDSFSVVTASGNKKAESLWNELVERYHYLGYGVPVGPHIKYIVHLDGENVACMAFSGAAWKIAVRDHWIGWSSEQREQGLRFVVNNSRFLIPPWVKVKNLASRLLGLAARRLPDDWQRLYAYSPLLLETFVHADRHHGTCYRAANWIHLGETKGRGKMDRYKLRALPRKSIFVYPLAPDATARLRAIDVAGSSLSTEKLGSESR